MSGIAPFRPEEVERFLADPEVWAFARAAVHAIGSDTAAGLVDAGTPESVSRKAAFAASVQGLGPRLALLPGLDRLPRDLADHLRAEGERGEARGKRIAGLLDELGSRFRAAGIRAIPLKGAALLLGGEIPAGLRPMADLDLLLDSEGEVRRAAAIVRAALGYEVLWNTERHLVLAEADEAVPLPACEHPANPLRIELHRSFRVRLLGTVLDATASLRSGTEERGGWELPGRDALLGHLLVHAAEDYAAKGLRGVQAVDFLALSRSRGALPLPEAPRSARAPLLYAVDALERLFPGTFDRGEVDRLAAGVDPRLRARAAALPILRHSRPPRGWTATTLSLADGTAAKARLLVRTLLPPLDEVRANVAPGAHGLALAATWGRVLARRVASGVSRLIGR